MDNPTTLLVAIMYVTIIVMGLANLLVALSDRVTGQQAFKPDPLHLGWILILFATYIAYFWETTFILEIEGWNFAGFVGFLSGPVLLFFTTSLLIALPEEKQALDSRRYYLQLSPRFFVLLVSVQGWVVGFDYLVDDVTRDTLLYMVVMVLLVPLIFSQSYRLHVILSLAAWLITIFRLAVIAF